MGYDKDRLKFQVGIELSQIKADLPKKAESNLIRLKYDLASYQLAKKRRNTLSRSCCYSGCYQHPEFFVYSCILS